MNILYIGHYKEGSGWSQAAIDYILALDSIGENVVCRNITLTSDKVDNIPKRILELEKKVDILTEEIQCLQIELKKESKQHDNYDELGY